MSGEQPWLTTVYGPQDDADKVLFLEELEAIRYDSQGPSVVAGDFNLILDPTDKNNTRVNRCGSDEQLMPWSSETSTYTEGPTPGVTSELIPPS